jgi:stearoyl-CoA desaturase (delta-9 desaturase)
VLIVGFLWSTVLVYHATFCINSLAHVRGRKRYVTGDDSRNNWILALFTLGEGWHNNHHAYQSSARQGFHWWEIDVTFYVLKALSLTGIIWNLRTPPADVLRNEQRLGSRVVNRAAEQLVSRFNPEQIALTVSSALHSSELSALREALGRARHQTAELPALLLSRIPTREELLEQAKIMFARTRSLDEIVDRAHQLLLRAVGSRLIASPG